MEDLTEANNQARLLKLENEFQTLRKKIDEFSDTIKFLQNSSSEKKDIQNIENKLNKITEKYENVTKSSDREIIIHANKITKSEKSIDSINSLIKFLETKLEELTHNLNIRIPRIDQIEKNSSNIKDVQSDLEMHKQKHLSQVNQFQSSLNDLNNLLTKIKSMADGTYLECKTLKDSLPKSIENLKNEVNVIKLVHNSEYQKLTDLLDSKLNTIYSYIDKKIAELPVPKIDTKIIQDAKNDVFAKFESVSLDAKNAILKSSNADMQIKMIEKKIENINLLLKKFELSS